MLTTFTKDLHVTAYEMARNSSTTERGHTMADMTGTRDVGDWKMAAPGLIAGQQVERFHFQGHGNEDLLDLIGKLSHI